MSEPGLIGPPIVLTRGQPVEIEVVNRVKDPTAIHWHGIELESYYDGVPGWSGAQASRQRNRSAIRQALPECSC
jgi:FtsP/CotA-like multicopper oxidase with cupredoxin domain